MYESRIHADCTVMEPSSVIRVHKDLFRRSRIFATFTGTIEDFMSIRGVAEYLLKHSVPLVYSFCLSHTVDAFLRYSMMRFKQVGCGPETAVC